MDFEDIVGLFPDAKRRGDGSYMAKCPAHDDRTPSLHISPGRDGRTLVRCMAGCDTAAVMAEAGGGLSDLFGGDHNHPGPGVTNPSLVSPRQAQRRNYVYTALLGACPLSQHHRQALLLRGLEEDDIRRNGYGTLNFVGPVEVIRKLAQTPGGSAALLTVPGFTWTPIPAGIDEWPNPKLREMFLAVARGCGGFVPGPPAGVIQLPRRGVGDGLMIPVRNPAGQIVALCLRPDGGDKKYVWLSRSGNSVGSPVHVPLGAGGMDTTVVRVTEGPLKADVTMALDPGTPTIAVPGINNINQLLATLQELGAKTVVIAYDNEWQKQPTPARDSNPVLYAMNRLYDLLRRAGYDVQFERWAHDPRFKGLDDLLYAGGKPIRQPMKAQLDRDPATGNWRWWGGAA
jgi:hypothetical protein